MLEGQSAEELTHISAGAEGWGLEPLLVNPVQPYLIVQQGCRNNSGHLLLEPQYLPLRVVLQKVLQSQDGQPAPAHDSAEGLPLPPCTSALSPWQHVPHAI